MRAAVFYREDRKGSCQMVIRPFCKKDSVGINLRERR